MLQNLDRAGGILHYPGKPQKPYQLHVFTSIPAYPRNVYYKNVSWSFTIG